MKFIRICVIEWTKRVQQILVELIPNQMNLYEILPDVSIKDWGIKLLNRNKSDYCSVFINKCLHGNAANI